MKRPELRGLVLGGGFSRRFGVAKISYRPDPGKPSWGEARVRLLRDLGLPVAVSLRPEQEVGFMLLPGVCRVDDCWPDGGPMVGLLSAWMLLPKAAWLVVACDLADLDRETLLTLLAARDSTRDATALIDPASGAPEPLCAIYEPSSHALLEARFVEGRRSLRGFLLDQAAAEAVVRCPSPRPLALRSRNRRESGPGED